MPRLLDAMSGVGCCDSFLKSLGSMLRAAATTTRTALETRLQQLRWRSQSLTILTGAACSFLSSQTPVQCRNTDP